LVFLQAENTEDLLDILNNGIKNLVVDNEIDLQTLLEVLEKNSMKVNLSLRMKFQEHRIGSGKYFVYGLSAIKVNKIISKIKENLHIDKLGIHIHRKSQNTSEWEIKQELEDSLELENLKRINIVKFWRGASDNL